MNAQTGVTKAVSISNAHETGYFGRWIRSCRHCHSQFHGTHMLAHEIKLAYPNRTDGLTYAITVCPRCVKHYEA